MTQSKGLICYLALSFWLATSTLVAQRDYTSFYQEMDPRVDSLEPADNLAKLDCFLADAQVRNDTVRMIHGYLYLANYCFLQADMEASAEHLVLAEQLAEKHQDTLLLGRILHRKGSLYINLIDYPQAIEYFKTAVNHHLQARDSQYLCLTYEQMGATYGYQGEYDEAERLYRIAFPLIESYGTKKQLAASYSNYGNILSYQDSTYQAIKYFQKAVELNGELGNVYQSVPCQQNLAGEYVKIGKLDEAARLFYRCLHLNKENGWKHFMIYTYLGLSQLHEKKGITDSILHYLRAYYDLKDSIVGADRQTYIQGLEYELELEKGQIEALQLETIAERQSRRIRNLIISAAAILLSMTLALLYVLQQKRNTKRRLHEKREALLYLTKSLQAKNAELARFNGKVQMDHTVEKAASTNGKPIINAYDTRILTNEDWQIFKGLFEKSYPGYLQRLRSTYVDLSEAEERLFLLIKLNLTSQEISKILGIKPDSVKKTRSRLRKRLDLVIESSLEDFVRTFK